jgi:hypothetical protein
MKKAPRIKFNAKSHTYKLGDKELISVTTYLKKYFSEFDAAKIARNLNKAKNTKWYGMGVRKIRALWKEQADYGSKIHKDIENYINDPVKYAQTKSIDPKVLNALEFYHNYNRGLNKPYVYPEFLLYNEELGLAGTIDLLILHTLPSGEIVADLIDWKTNTKFTTESKNRCLAPFDYLPDCHLIKYGLQLSLYKVLVETKDESLVKPISFRVNKMIIAHIDDVKVNAFEVGDFSKEVKVVLEDLRK